MKVTFRPGVEDDLRAISNAVVQKNALGWISRLSRGTAGEPIPCGWRQSTGDLTDCFKLYFDERDDPRKGGLPEDRRPRHYRIVYRIVDDGRTLEVVAVGPGHPPPDEPSAYSTAGERLGRIMRRPQGRRGRGRSGSRRLAELVGRLVGPGWRVFGA